MILVDTSIWVDHLRVRNSALAALLDGGEVLVHPFVTGELALGSLRQRKLILGILQELPQASVATNLEVLQFVEHHRLFGCGIGYVDAHLLAAARLSENASLWTRDRRLRQVAASLGLAPDLPA
jgi:predicted nucleic acid-binding protein